MNLTIEANEEQMLEFKVSNKGNPFVEFNSRDFPGVYNLTKQDMENLVTWLQANLDKGW